jgi:hypothetical protein
VVSAGFAGREEDFGLSAHSQLAILAVEQVAHSFLPSLVYFFYIAECVGVRTTGHFRIRYGRAALRAAVREAWLIRLQLEFLRADNADFDGKGHLLHFMPFVPV